MPVVNVDWAERDPFLTTLAHVEKSADAWESKGFSTCRVCGCINGSTEFRLDGWRWGDGFVHYLRDHGVRPTTDFEAFVLSRV